MKGSATKHTSDRIERMKEAAPELYDELAYLVAGLERYNNNPYQEELPDWTEAKALLARIYGSDGEENGHD